MLYIGGIIILAALAFFTVYNIRHSEGKLHKAVVAVNIVIAAAALLTVITGYVAFRIDRSDSKAYTSHGGMFHNITYKGTEDGCYVFSESGFLTGGRRFAVPVEDAELPSLTKNLSLFYSVIIYTDGDDTHLPERIAHTSQGDLPVWGNTVKISMYLLGPLILAALLLLSVDLIFGTAVFIAVLHYRDAAEAKQ